jgi:hypothetical protein
MYGMDKEDFLNAFVESTHEMVNIARKKNNDYTASDDPFDNFNAVEVLGVCKAETGILVRMTDKYKRLISLLNGKEQLVLDESIDDTLLDLANYAVILRLLRRNKQMLLQPPPLERKFIEQQNTSAS